MEKTQLFLEGFIKQALDLGFNEKETQDLYSTYRLYKMGQSNPQALDKGYKEAIQTGPLGYLTSSLFAPFRASELKGTHKAIGEKSDSMFIRHPYLSYLLSTGIGAGLGGIAGAGIGTGLGRAASGGSGGAALGGLAGSYGGAITGASIASILNSILQQHAVNKAVKKLKRSGEEETESITKGELVRRLRKGTWKPKAK